MYNYTEDFIKLAYYPRLILFCCCKVDFSVDWSYDMVTFVTLFFFSLEEIKISKRLIEIEFVIKRFTFKFYFSPINTALQTTAHGVYPGKLLI